MWSGSEEGSYLRRLIVASLNSRLESNKGKEEEEEGLRELLSGDEDAKELGVVSTEVWREWSISGLSQVCLPGLSQVYLRSIPDLSCREASHVTGIRAQRELLSGDEDAEELGVVSEEVGRERGPRVASQVCVSSLGLGF